jgi:hypothetical protein
MAPPSEVIQLPYVPAYGSPRNSCANYRCFPDHFSRLHYSAAAFCANVADLQHLLSPRHVLQFFGMAVRFGVAQSAAGPWEARLQPGNDGRAMPGSFVVKQLSAALYNKVNR